MRTVSVDAARAKNLKPTGEANFNAFIAYYKINAKKRRFKWELSTDQFRKLSTSPCHYCGTPHSKSYDKSPKNGTKRLNGAFVCNGIDRVDRLKGYSIENCVPCCQDCNVSKGTKTVTQFIDWIRKVALFQHI